MRKIILLLIPFLGVYAGVCHAQTELSVQTAYEIPLDELKWIYNPAANYQVNISKTDKYKNQRNVTGISLGYTRFVSREEVFYYRVNSDEFGMIHYDPYQVLQLALSFRKDFILGKVELFLGAEVGYQYVIYGYRSADAYIQEDAGYVVNRAMIAPKTGVNYILTDHISAFVSFQYRCSLGFEGDNRSDLINYFIAPGAGLNFRL